MSMTESNDADKVVSSVSAALKAVWWIPLIRGIFLFILGLLLMIEPLTALSILVWLFGAFLLLDGVTAIAQGLANRDQSGWKWWLVQGIVDIIFAIVIMAWPGISATILLYVLLIWTVVLGIAAIIGAVALARNKDLGWAWLLTFGLLSVFFGGTMLGRGLDGMEPLALLAVVFGIYACVLGAVQIVSAFSVRAAARDIDDALKGNSAVLEALVERRVAKLQEEANRAAAAEAERAAAHQAKEAEKAAAQAEKEAEKARRAAEKEAAKHAGASDVGLSSPELPNAEGGEPGTGQ